MLATPSVRRAGLALYRRWAVRSVCTPATPTISERIVEAATSAPSKKFDAVRQRGGSLGDAVAAMREKKMQEDKNDAFSEQTQILIKLPKFTMSEFRDLLQDSLDKPDAGMTYLNKARLQLDTMRGGSTAKMIEGQKETIQRQINIIGQMTPCEVDRPALVGYLERERIEKVCQPAAGPCGHGGAHGGLARVPGCGGLVSARVPRVRHWGSTGATSGSWARCSSGRR